MDSLETSCIFRSAYHVSQGADLSGIRVNGTGRRIAVFLLEGENIVGLDKAYQAGQALVNPLQLREALNLVRDRLFKRLQQNESKGRARNGKRKERRR